MLASLTNLAAAAIILTAASTHATDWTFESPDLEGAKYSAEVPAPFLYDPLTKTSRRNTASVRFEPGQPVLALPVETLAPGCTLECFVRVDAAAETPIVYLPRQHPASGEFGLLLDHFSAHNQWYLRPFTNGEGMPVGYYGSAAQYKGGEDRAWRHLAWVHDPEAKTISGYIDSFLTKIVPAPPGWEVAPGPLVLGGRQGAPAKFTGLIDEVRLTPQALGPADFLRARATPLEGASFHSVETVLPRGSGYIDIKEHFGAVGDGVADDTDAFNAAFRALPSRVPLAHYTLYIAPGTYLLSDTVAWSRFLTVQGAGSARTTLRLKDGAAGYNDPQTPRAVVKASSTGGPPGSNKAVNGSSIANTLIGITIDTGRGNAGAVGLEYHSNNVGRLDDVVIRSGDGTGHTGLDLTHKTNGPALIKRVKVEGFDFGVTFNYQEYSMTFEHLALAGQKRAGIWNRGNILAIRGLRSENAVAAILSEGANSMVTLLDADLRGGAPDAPAIYAEGGLYARNVTTAGYGHAIRKRVAPREKDAAWEERMVAAGRVEEWAGDRIVMGHGTPGGSLRLPVEETPDLPAGDVARDWVSVERFAEHKVGDDWAPAIQAAIDSGSPTVYFPHGSYPVLSAVQLRGKVRRLHGMHGGISRHADFAPADGPVLIVSGTEAAATYHLERIEADGLRHASPATLVIASSSVKRFENAPGAGKLFIEDNGDADWHFDHPQRVWARQWNPESHAAGPCITSRGATVWSLGFKTEYESSKLLAEAGAKTEILGGFIYPIGKIPADRPIFENIDSAMSLIYGTSVYGSNHTVHIIDTQRGVRKEYGNEALRYAGSRGRMDLFVTRP